MAKGYWLAADEMPTAAKQYVFTRTFEAAEGASMTARLSADGRYQLWLNGSFVCDGPCQGSEFQHFYETADLTPYLKNGTNQLVMRVLYLPVGVKMSINTFRHGKPAIWFEGTIRENGKETVLESDEQFRCERVDSIDYRLMEYEQLTSMPPAEDWQGDEVRTPVVCHTLYQPSLVTFDVYGVSEPLLMYERPIPLLRPEQIRPFTVLRQSDNAVELDAGRYTTAMVRFVLKGTKGSRVRITYAECYLGKDGKKGRRDATEGLIKGPTDSIVMTGEEQVFEPFFFRAFRVIRLASDDGAAFTFNAEASGYGEYFYPFAVTGSFECSDPVYNAMWETSIRTLLCCSHELFVDCPYYEQQQYDQDGFLESLFAYCLSNDVQMQRKIITDFAHSQRPNGMLQANYPSTLVQIISDFPLFWVFMLREYLSHTGDLAFVRTMFGTLFKMLDCFDARITEDGLVGRTPYWQFVDWVPGWEYGVPNFGKDAPITFDSLIYAAALGDAADLAAALGKPHITQEYRERKDAVIEAVNRCCYDEKAAYYRDAPTIATYSQHTAVWAILSGAVAKENAAALLEKAFTEVDAKCSFSMNHFMFRALEKAGLYEKYAGKVFGGWQQMLENGCTTWCENPDEPRSECHAWSSAPIYEFSAKILGVKPSAKGYSAVTVSPDFKVGDLNYAKGTVPTPWGDIAVSWEKTGDGIELDIRTPEDHDITLNVVLPDRALFFTNSHHYHTTVAL